MQLTPWYGADPIITIDGRPDAIAEPLLRQRRRLADLLASFTDDQWTHPSRCAGWTNRDVITHLQSTNAFWGFSIAMGLKGEPTQFLATFDPVASPAQLVADAPDVSTDECSVSCGVERALMTRSPASTRRVGHHGRSAVRPRRHRHARPHALWDGLIHETTSSSRSAWNRSKRPTRRSLRSLRRRLESGVGGRGGAPAACSPSSHRSGRRVHREGDRPSPSPTGPLQPGGPPADRGRRGPARG